MKILFLDIDGVLNSEEFFKSQVSHFKNIIPIENRHQVDKTAIDLLNSLDDISDLFVVVISNWRRDSTCRDFLFHSGLRLQFHNDWRTEDMESGRGNEIYCWLQKEDIDRNQFVVLDDSYINSYRDRLVQPDYKTGLQQRHIDKIRELLS